MGSPLFLVGIALFFGGGVTLMGVLFSSGGASKSRQLGVLAALLRGEHGGARRALTRASLAMLALSLPVTFSAVAAGDRQRAAACRQTCARLGYTAGVIGPSQARNPQRPGLPAFVACRCVGGRADDTELRADDLTATP